MNELAICSWQRHPVPIAIGSYREAVAIVSWQTSKKIIICKKLLSIGFEGLLNKDFVKHDGDFSLQHCALLRATVEMTGGIFLRGGEIFLGLLQESEMKVI
jgi:hypothetical protein